MQNAIDEMRLKQAAVIDEVRAERTRQDANWGEQKHSLTTWAVRLGEELGEAAEAALNMQAHARLGAPSLSAKSGGAYRAELVQLAAAACTAWECSVHGVAPAPNEADRNQILELVARQLEKQPEKSMTRTSRLDPLIQVCAIQCLIGEVSTFSLQSIGSNGTYDEFWRDRLLTLASATINAIVFLDLGTWTWREEKGGAA